MSGPQGVVVAAAAGSDGCRLAGAVYGDMVAAAKGGGDRRVVSNSQISKDFRKFS